MLATFLVSNLVDMMNEDDPWPGSLRAAVEAANGNDNNDDEHDIILFVDGLAGTITLDGGQLDIEEQVSILGPGPLKLGVQASPNSRIFDINIDGDDEFFPVAIGGLTLAGGRAITGEADNRLGGGIWNREDLTLTEVIMGDNTAQRGGGAIFHEFGFLNVSRSYFGSGPTTFAGNSSFGIGGGAILVGLDGDEMENLPTANIVNSSFYDNSSAGDGGAIFNRRGTLIVRNSTIVGNEARLGGGLASYGNAVAAGATMVPPPMPLPDPPAPVIFTYVVSSIFFDNMNTGIDPVRMQPGGDLDEVGVTPPPMAMTIQLALEPSVISYGVNIIGATSITKMRTAPPDPMDPFGLDPTDMIGVDPMLDGPFGPVYRGGSMPIFLPLLGSPAIDAGSFGPFAEPDFDQRGRHFTRTFNNIVDIGAAETQVGLFTVDLIADESDSQFSTVSPFGGDPYTFGDFSLREAILFSEANPEVDTIDFVNFTNGHVDPTISPAPTILLRGGFGPLAISSSVFIEGPAEYILEIDASGNDLTPLVNNSDGSRVFNIDNGSSGSLSDIVISNLAIMGGDTAGSGGGIFNRENLELIEVTIRENNASSKGGGLYHQYGTLLITGSTFSGNRAADDGGGLFIEGAAAMPAVNIENSTFSGNNAADRAAGIGNNNAALTLSYVTVTKNTSGAGIGSGINNFGATASTTLYSTVVSGNQSRDVDFLSASGATINSFTSLGYNFIGITNAASKFNQVGDRAGSMFTNPMLEVLATSGGLTATHRPLPGSPLIDMGNPADLPANPATPEFDQRGPGFVRVFDGNMDTVLRIDIGAYELQPTFLLVDNAQDASDGDYSTGNFSLREAVELSNSNPLLDTIMFSPALSVITVGGVGVLTITITDSVHIIGPGALNLAVGATQVLPQQFVHADRILTIDNGLAGFIDVDISGLEFRNAQVGAIFSRENLTLNDITFIDNENVTAGGALFHELGAFKIANSTITGNSTNAPGADGGAMYFRDVNGGRKVEFDYSTISGNFTSQTAADGGGVFIKNSVAEFRAITISGNSTLAGTADAGGIYLDGSTVLFEESTISGNATIGANSEGGGLFVNGATSAVTITKNSSINFNSTLGSQSAGGGAFVAGGTLTIENSNLLQNGTAGLSAAGGAIALTGGAVNLLGTSVHLNNVTGLNGNGGGIANLGGNLSVRDSTISANQTTSANSNGGGVYSNTDLSGAFTTRIINSTISGNSTALRGGGLFNADGITEIRHSTITNNSTPYLNAGNGVASVGNAVTRTTVESSIIAGNAGAGAGTGSDADFDGAQFLNSFTSVGYNVIGTGNALAEFVEPGDKTGIVNPLLGPLADNGGLTRTHALLAGSAAINAGKPSFNPNTFSPPLTTDQRGVGFARVLGGRIDSGAFESPPPAFSADFSLNGRVDGDDFLIWQRFNGLLVGGTKATGDANLDGKVNSADLALWRAQFGAGAAEAVAIPASVGGGSEEPVAAQAAVAADEPEFAFAAPSILAASVEIAAFSATTDSPAPLFTPLAGVGTPGASASSGRPAYRPAADRRVAARDAAHAIHGTHLAQFDGTTAARPRGAKLALGDGDYATNDGAAGDPAGAAEDAVFALVGEGLL